VVRLSPGVADAVSGVRRLEVALGLTPSHVAPTDDDGAIELSEEQMRSLQEVAGRLKDVKRQKARASAQLAGATRDRKQVAITQATLGQLPPGTRTFRAVGRMFLHSPGGEVDGLLGERAAKADAKVRVCESTLAYLASQEADAEAAYTEVVKAVQAAQGRRR
jgi:prefoldin subunit 1